MRQLLAEPAYGVGAQLGEGPVWDGVIDQLLFVDILSGRLYRSVDTSSVEVIAELDEPLGAALPAEDDGILLATRSGFSLLSNGRVDVLQDLFGDRPDLRLNDAKCDPAGRCFAGTLSLVEAPADAALLRLDRGPTTTIVVLGVGLANGLGWSPDGRTLYFTDTLSGRVDQFEYDVERGTLGRRSAFVTETPGTPDGLCVDSAGSVWIALWAGGEVHRYSPDGALDTVVRLPVPHVTSCAFGGPDDRTLFITTARAGLSDQDLVKMPYAGDVFAIQPGADAPPATRWRPLESA